MRYEMMPENTYETSVPLIRTVRLVSSAVAESWSASSRVEWLRTVRNRLRKLTELQTGWDGYDGRRVTVDTTLFAFQILQDLYKAKLPTPDISPMSSGGIMVEWLRDNRELTIEVLGPYRTRYLFEEDDEETEGDIGSDLSVLQAYVGRLSAPQAPVAG